MTKKTQRATGHTYLVKRKRGDQWYAKYRLPDGRQVQKRLGPAHTGHGTPARGPLHQEDGARRRYRRSSPTPAAGRSPG